MDSAKHATGKKRANGHRWGTRWLTPSGYAALQHAQQQSQSRIDLAKQTVEALKSDIENFLRSE